MFPLEREREISSATGAGHIFLIVVHVFGMLAFIFDLFRAIDSVVITVLYQR